MIRFEINGSYRVIDIFRVGNVPSTITVYGRSINGPDMYLITDIGRFLLHESDDHEYIVLGGTDISPTASSNDRLN